MAEDNDDYQLFVMKNSRNDIDRIFKNNPTIEHYLELRKEHPHKEIELSTNIDLDWAYENRGLLFENGIDYLLMNEAICGDKNAISTISLILLQKIADRDKLKKAGETQLVARKIAISDKFINYLIAIMFDSLSWNNDLETPRDLIMLNKRQLLGSEMPALTQNKKSKEIKSKAISNAARLLESDGKISIRKVANSLGVNVTTISRMFSDNEIEIRASALLGAMKDASKSETPYADGDIDDFEVLKVMK